MIKFKNLIIIKDFNKMSSPNLRTSYRGYSSGSEEEQDNLKRKMPLKDKIALGPMAKYKIYSKI